MSTVNPRLSAITPDDFGLKAGFWDRRQPDAIKFRPIVGWVSVTNYAEAGKLPFVAVVLSDHGQPTFAAPSYFPDYVGVFEKSLSGEQAIKRCEAGEVGSSPPTSGEGTMPPSTGIPPMKGPGTPGFTRPVE